MGDQPAVDMSKAVVTLVKAQDIMDCLQGVPARDTVEIDGHAVLPVMALDYVGNLLRLAAEQVHQQRHVCFGWPAPD